MKLERRYLKENKKNIFLLWAETFKYWIDTIAVFKFCMGEGSLYAPEKVIGS